VDPKPYISAVVERLRMRRLVVLQVNHLPGQGVEFLCRLPKDLADIWNLMAFTTLTRESTLVVRFNRTLVPRSTDAGMKLLEGGAIQIWGGSVGLPAALQALAQCIASAPLPAAREVTEIYVPASEFYKPQANGRGVHGEVSNKNPFIPFNAGAIQGVIK
jgi:hypothetical protein